MSKFFRIFVVMIYPFSILDTRTKDWKDRKSWWITNFSIQSELGREQTVSKSTFWESETNVSIFDPVLCEMMYSWFCPPNGKILDPFAGGSVRGIVAEELGFVYEGIDLSETQIEANRLQSSKPTWMVGDSDHVLDTIPNDDYDFLFTCPPYHDLEKYSEDKDDLSNMDYDSFLQKYKSILSKSFSKLKDNRFFGIVVSEIRDASTTRNYKIGKYKGFVSDTIKLAEECGFHFYNDMILYNSQHQASRTYKTYFDRNRKIPSVHQNVLVFVKGNPDIATIEIEGGEPICRVDGKEYLSFRHAAIDIDPSELVGSEVERRCKSTKSKYKDWQIIGQETKPLIKYEVDGVPFENPKQIVNKFGIDLTESMVRNYIDSNNPQYRHWKRVDGKWDISYQQMEKLQSKPIRFSLTTISCNGVEFISVKDASDYFGLSNERIRQKLNSGKFPEYFYLFG